eukprot:gene17803-biopygen5134
MPREKESVLDAETDAEVDTEVDPELLWLSVSVIVWENVLLRDPVIVLDTEGLSDGDTVMVVVRDDGVWVRVGVLVTVRVSDPDSEPERLAVRDVETDGDTVTVLVKPVPETAPPVIEAANPACSGRHKKWPRAFLYCQEATVRGCP